MTKKKHKNSDAKPIAKPASDNSEELSTKNPFGGLPDRALKKNLGCG